MLATNKSKVALVGRQSLTGAERSFAADDVIVSKTDTRGILTYVNDVFIDISGYEEDELLGKPHSLIRHPHMPRCVFKLLWDTLEQGEEIFAYVNNRCKNGDNYWVLAHVTPTFGMGQKIVGYHSSRRRPRMEVVNILRPVYQQLYEEECRHSNSQSALEAGTAMLNDFISKTGKNYDQFIFSL